MEFNEFLFFLAFFRPFFFRIEFFKIELTILCLALDRYVEFSYFGDVDMWGRNKINHEGVIENRKA